MEDSSLKLGLLFVLVLFLLADVSSLYAQSETTAATARRVDVAASSRASARVSFNHKVLVHPLPGLPSAITLSIDKIKATQVRALLVLDGELLVISLEYFSSASVFHGMFPAPKKSLSYQFQIISADGGSYLSKEFFVDPECSDIALENILSGARNFSFHEKMVREALRLDHQRVVLEYLVGAIASFKKSRD